MDNMLYNQLQQDVYRIIFDDENAPPPYVVFDGINLLRFWPPDRLEPMSDEDAMEYIKAMFLATTSIPIDEIDKLLVHNSKISKD